MEDEIILVDIFDKEIGKISKLDAHRKPRLHRAFSVFLYDGNKMLIQKRALNKYHSGGLFANSCCSHPRYNKSFDESIKDRLIFELNIKNVDLKEIDTFIYKTKFNDNLFEYEYDHILVGKYDSNLKIDFNKDEIEEILWVDIDELNNDVINNPEKYSTWFLTAYPKVVNYLKK